MIKGGYSNVNLILNHLQAADSWSRSGQKDAKADRDLISLGAYPVTSCPFTGMPERGSGQLAPIVVRIHALRPAPCDLAIHRQALSKAIVRPRREETRYKSDSHSGVDMLSTRRGPQVWRSAEL